MTDAATGLHPPLIKYTEHWRKSSGFCGPQSKNNCKRTCCILYRKRHTVTLTQVVSLQFWKPQHCRQWVFLLGWTFLLVLNTQTGILKITRSYSKVHKGSHPCSQLCHPIFFFPFFDFSHLEEFPTISESG